MHKMCVVARDYRIEWVSGKATNREIPHKGVIHGYIDVARATASPQEKLKNAFDRKYVFGKSLRVF